MSENGSGTWSVYLSGEIHSDWRERIAEGVREAGLPVELLAPVTDHGASDDVGVDILGPEQDGLLEGPQGRRGQRGPHPDAAAPRRRRRRPLRRQVPPVERRLRGRLRRGARQAAHHPPRPRAHPRAQGGRPRRDGDRRDPRAGRRDPRATRSPARASAPDALAPLRLPEELHGDDRRPVVLERVADLHRGRRAAFADRRARLRRGERVRRRSVRSLPRVPGLDRFLGELELAPRPSA